MFVFSLVAVFLIIFLQVKNKSLHPLYLIFPIIAAAGFLSRGFSEDRSEFLVTLESGEQIDCQLTGTVMRTQNSDSGYKIYLKNVTVVDAEPKQVENCLIYSKEKYLKGDRLAVSGTARCFKTPDNPGEFDLRLYYRTVDLFYSVYANETKLIDSSDNPVYKLADKLSDKLESALYSVTDEETASVFGAMLLGKKEDIDSQLSELFTNCGIGHILAISGLHISLLGMGLYKLIRKCGAGYVMSMAAGSGFIIFYGVMTGGGVSQTRALIMFIAAVHANVAGRTYDMLSAAALAAVLMLLKTPMLIHSSGFLLSFGAIIGITVVGGAIRNSFNIQNKTLGALITGISIQLVTLPIIMYYYYQIPVLSVILNLLVVPLMTVVMVSGIAGACAGCVSITAGTFAIGPGVMVIRLYEKICNANMNIDWAVYICGKPQLWQITVYYILLAAVIWLISKHTVKPVITVIIPALSLLIMRFDSGFELDFISVGQGDGIFIRMANGKNVLIDGGSSDNSGLYQYTLEPFLLSKAVDQIDYAIVTHCDNDHISGLKELMENGSIHINNFYMPSTTLVDDAYTSLWNTALEYADNTELIYAGTELTGGDTMITCIHPSYNYQCSERNDYSTTLVVENKGFTALLTGDISASQETELIETVRKYAPFDVLKAAHHGSDTSSSHEFLKAVNPGLAVISCGLNNSYGHPSEQTLSRLENLDIPYLTTMEHGAVIIRTKGQVCNVNVFY